MSKFHDEYNKIIVPLVEDINENINVLEEMFADSADVIKRRLKIGGINRIEVYVVYIDNMIDKLLIEEGIFFYLLYKMELMPARDQFDYIKEHGLRAADLGVVFTMNECMEHVFGGDTLIFVDGYEKAIWVSYRKIPSRGVEKSENEVAIRGSKESFSEALYINRVLLRRRVKDTKFKIKQIKIGTRTKTDVAIAYIDDLVRPEILLDIESRINDFIIDGIFDSGMLEQLLRHNKNSIFPEFQATERPDKVASAITEGRIAIIVDNSPMVLLLPTTLNSFFQASDDAYNHWSIASWLRILRYIGAFLTLALPGLYIAVVNYQAEVLSSALALSMAASRAGVPFSVLIEVIIMELAFEMLLEAGVRLPGPMGNTLGIVGGLIIGDAAVSANLVSPVVVIIVALTAIAAFTVPNEEFASTFRIIRYLIIFLSAFFGLFGFVIGLMLILIHLASLKSFGTLYLSPFVASEINDGSDRNDAFIKRSIKDLKKRPIFTMKNERNRLIWKNKEKK